MRNATTRKLGKIVRLIVGAVLIAIGVLGAPLSLAIHFAPLIGTGDTEVRPILAGLIPAFLALCAGVILWVSVLRRTDGDDPFAGERGTYVSAMVVITLMIIVAAGWMMIQPDFWSGFFEGTAD